MVEGEKVKWGNYIKESVNMCVYMVFVVLLLPGAAANVCDIARCG